MFAVLHIADFALHAVLRMEPDVAGRPAALFANTSKKSIVLATNAGARAAGVELGMTAPQAVARCASLIIRSPQADAETDARAALLAVGFTLSPSIEDTAPGICTADVKGFDSAKLESAIGAAAAELTALGLPATGGIARTPLLALYAARAVDARARDRALNPKRPFNSSIPSTSTNTTSEDPILRAEHFALAEDPALYSCPNLSRSSFSLSSSPDPNGATHLQERKRKKKEGRERVPFSVLTIPVTDESTFLTALPLTAADPSPTLALVFANWGLRTLGDLTALPRDEIVRRFGTEGLALWQRANGGAPRPLHPIAPTQHFAASMEFENEIETLEPLLFILRRFLDRLTLELRASQHVAVEMALELRLEDVTRHVRSFRLPEPTADTEILFRTLHTHLESVQTDASICALELCLTPARPLVRQQSLFETSLRDPHGFAETLARVSALVGSDRVGTPQLEDTHRPDAFKLVPPTIVISPPASAAMHAPMGAPLRRFRPPLPVRFGHIGERVYVWSEAVRGEIAFQSQPYFKDGEWWQADRSWSRLEWDIALTEGGLYRLLQIGGNYFIEGEYD